MGYNHQPPTCKVTSLSISDIMPRERMNQIEKKIGGKPVFVISKSYCPFCKKAKQILKKYNIKPENIEIMEIDNDEDCNEIQEFMKKLTGGRSVPRVFIGGKFLGGGDETEAAHREGTLQALLETAGAL